MVCAGCGARCALLLSLDASGRTLGPSGPRGHRNDAPVTILRAQAESGRGADSRGGHLPPAAPGADLRLRLVVGFRSGVLATDDPCQLKRSLRAAIVIRSLRIVAVGALRMRRLSSRTALARRTCCLKVVTTEILSPSTVGGSPTSCSVGDAGRPCSADGCEIVTAGQLTAASTGVDVGAVLNGAMAGQRCVVRGWCGRRTNPSSGRSRGPGANPLMWSSPPKKPATMRPLAGDDALRR